MTFILNSTFGLYSTWIQWARHLMFVHVSVFFFGRGSDEIFHGRAGIPFCYIPLLRLWIRMTSWIFAFGGSHWFFHIIWTSSWFVVTWTWITWARLRFVHCKNDIVHIKSTQERNWCYSQTDWRTDWRLAKMQKIFLFVYFAKCVCDRCG